MKVLLIFPPAWPPVNPHLAVPSLTAYLRAHGIDVAQCDLNAQFFDDILTPSYLLGALERIREVYGPQGARAVTDEVLPDPGLVRWSLQAGPDLAAQVDAAKGVIRSDEFYDGPVGNGAMQVIRDCLTIASLPFHPLQIQLQNCAPPLYVDSSRRLLAEVPNPDRNMFLDVFRRGIIDEIERAEADVVGVAVPSMDQFLPALTLGYLIKIERRLACHVVLGGPHITIVRDGLARAPHLFDLFDSAVTFEGEIPLLRLVETLDAGADLGGVPNLMYRKGGEVRRTQRVKPERMSDLPLPDFGGLALDRYLAPSLVLPLLSARGCYYGKCTFCSVAYGDKPAFSQLPATQLAEQMRLLSEQYGTRHIYLVDEAITPSAQLDLPALLAGTGNTIHWGGCVRVEEAIDREARERMAAGGCRLNLVGLESASEDVQARMWKGTSVAAMSRFLQDNAAAGIWNHAFFIFGFPGETETDAGRTLDFVFNHLSSIHSLAVAPFSLTRDSPIHLSPAAFGVTPADAHPDRDLAVFHDYEVRSGLDQEAAQQLCANLAEQLPPLGCMQFYCSDAYRLLCASYLSDRGARCPTLRDHAASQSGGSSSAGQMGI